MLQLAPAESRWARLLTCIFLASARSRWASLMVSLLVLLLRLHLGFSGGHARGWHYTILQLSLLIVMMCSFAINIFATTSLYQFLTVVLISPLRVTQVIV